MLLTIDESALSGHRGHPDDIIPAPAGGCAGASRPDDDESTSTTRDTGSPTTLRPVTTTTRSPITDDSSSRTTVTVPTSSTVVLVPQVEIVQITIPVSSDGSPVVPTTLLPLNRPVTPELVTRSIATMSQNIQDFSLPVFVRGSLPNPGLKGPVIIQTAGESRADITIEDNTIELRDRTGFRLAVGAVDGEGRPLEMSSTGAIIVEQENFIRVTGAGFAPDSDAVAWLFSDPQRLGVVKVASNGTFEASFQLPEGVPVGEHTAQVNGVTAKGDIRSLNLAIDVVVPGAATVVEAPIDQPDVSDEEPQPKFTLVQKPFDVGQASGWIGLLMLIMLIVAYAGDSPLISSRRRAPKLYSAALDEALSMRRLGTRRYALAVTAAGLVVAGLSRTDFLPVYPTAYWFAVVMAIAAADPFAGLVAGLAGFAAVVVGGGVASVDDLRAAIVMAVTYAGAPMLASAVARRTRRTTSSVVSVVAGIVVYLIAAVTLTRVNGALLRAELAIDKWILLLLIPAAMVLAVRCVLDQQYEQQHRRELALRRLPLTLGLIPAALAVLAFVVLSKVLIDDESLLTLLLLGLVAGLRQAQASMRFPRTPTPSRSRRVGARGNASRRPPASRTH